MPMTAFIGVRISWLIVARNELLASFAASAAARACLVSLNMPHVLDRDHRLVGERLQQADFRRRERTNLVAQQRDHADRLAFAQQRHVEHRAESVACLQIADVRVFGVHDRGHVLDMDDPALEHGAAADRGLLDRQRFRHPRSSGRSGRSVVIARNWAPSTSQTRLPSARQSCPARSRDGFQHRLHFGRRLADHAQDFGRRRLPLERLLRLVEQARCSGSRSRPGRRRSAAAPPPCR